MLICTIKLKIRERIIPNEKAAFKFCVKTADCVRNPGPIAEVAMRKAAPNKTLNVPFLSRAFFSPISFVVPFISTTSKSI
ncbi:hypothetical protein SDC9_200089 [bioreactor metagenome]|uniref:Uncharacterized protein n=1 Tax=bioreactor metagenome TaxID=1076179 RepID=A0A645IMA8_9ZZZZ